MISAIVLAGGASTRMGRPKALLPSGGRTFVRRILDTLHEGGVSDVIVVVRPDADEVRREIDAASFGRSVINPDPDRGQLSSLLVALDAIRDEAVTGVMVTLVDVPLVRAGTIAALLDAARTDEAPILRATYQHRHGHPVIFRRPVFAALRAADLTQGAKPVMRAHLVRDIEVDDPGVLVDVDTPADYEQWRDRF